MIDSDKHIMLITVVESFVVQAPILYLLSNNSLMRLINIEPLREFILMRHSCKDAFTLAFSVKRKRSEVRFSIDELKHLVLYP